MKLKIPNILTIGRIIIVPIFVLTFFIPGFFGDLIPTSTVVSTAIFRTPPRKLLDSARGVSWRPQANQKKEKKLGDGGCHRGLECPSVCPSVRLSHPDFATRIESNESVQRGEVTAATRSRLVSSLRQDVTTC